jgi:hypothetical protein
MIAALGGIAGMAIVERAAAADAHVPKTSDHPLTMSDVEKEYRRLRPLWEKERERFSASSDTHDYWKGPRGKAIIALGPAIIPYLIQELRKGDFFFNVPLAIITNVEIDDGKLVYSEQDDAKLWLKWWDSAREKAKP